VVELQADEIRTIIGGREQAIWVFVVIDVWSRLWPSTVVGKRNYRNTLGLFQDLSSRMNLEIVPLNATDGFKFYQRVIGRVFGPACLYGQVIKTRSNHRVVRVERRAARIRIPPSPPVASRLPQSRFPSIASRRRPSR
jgi:IS1 family transposase